MEHQLLQGLADHRAAPNDGLVGIDQKADGHHLDAAFGFDGNQFFVLLVRFAVLHAQHGRLARTVEVGIQYAHACAHACHGGGKIGGGGGFADTAFAGCNGDNVFDAFDGGNAGLYFVRCDFRVDAEVDMRVARDADDGFLQAVGDVGGDVADGESEFQSDMEAVGTFFQQLDGFFTAERAFGTGDFYCFQCSLNGCDIHGVSLVDRGR